MVRTLAKQGNACIATNARAHLSFQATCSSLELLDFPQHFCSTAVEVSLLLPHRLHLGLRRLDGLMQLFFSHLCLLQPRVPHRLQLGPQVKHPRVLRLRKHARIRHVCLATHARGIWMKNGMKQLKPACRLLHVMSDLADEFVFLNNGLLQPSFDTFKFHVLHLLFLLKRRFVVKHRQLHGHCVLCCHGQFCFYPVSSPKLQRNMNVAGLQCPSRKVALTSCSTLVSWSRAFRLAFFERSFCKSRCFFCSSWRMSFLMRCKSTIVPAVACVLVGLGGWLCPPCFARCRACVRCSRTVGCTAAPGAALVPSPVDVVADVTVERLGSRVKVIHKGSCWCS